MKKTRLIGKKALSWFLSVSLLLTPLGTKCFADSEKEQIEQQILESLQEIQEGMQEIKREGKDKNKNKIVILKSIDSKLQDIKKMCQENRNSICGILKGKIRDIRETIKEKLQYIKENKSTIFSHIIFFIKYFLPCSVMMLIGILIFDWILAIICDILNYMFGFKIRTR